MYCTSFFFLMKLAWICIRIHEIWCPLALNPHDKCPPFVTHGGRLDSISIRSSDITLWIWNQSKNSTRFLSGIVEVHFSQPENGTASKYIASRMWKTSTKITSCFSLKVKFSERTQFPVQMRLSFDSHVASCAFQAFSSLRNGRLQKRLCGSNCDTLFPSH